MILRRLAGHLRHDNWFTVILELVVVVVGLFLAFQLDSSRSSSIVGMSRNGASLICKHTWCL